MSTLVFVEHHDRAPQESALGVLGKAASLGGDVAAVVCGEHAREVAAELGRYGAQRVFAADAPALAAPLPQPRVDVITALIGEHGFDTVLLGSSVLAADIAAALAARLEAGLNYGLVDLRLDGDRLVGVQPILGDSAYANVGWTATPRLALFRSGVLEPRDVGGSADVINVSPSVHEWSQAARLLEQDRGESEGPSIEEADIIVAGGRGLGAPEHFSIVEDLAQALGGAVGATRAVVDAGWYPYSTQVGQTGKTVTPKLYVACGISGAIQHKVGMQNASVIVAINKDRNAPIFDYCDLGVVGDLHQIVPKLTELIRQRTSG